MPAIVSLLLGGLIQIAGSVLGRVLVGMALGFVEFIGLQTLFSSVKDQAQSLVSGFTGSSLMLAWAGFFQVDVHISIAISAVSMRMLLNGLNSDSVKKLVSK